MMETVGLAKLLKCNVFDIYDKIHKVTDYDLFKTQARNRDVVHKHVETLEYELKTLGQIMPIAINEHFEILDGQHRFNAIKNINDNRAIKVIVIENGDLEHTKSVNRTSRIFKGRDYRDIYKDIKDYQLLEDFEKRYENGKRFCLDSIVAILNNGATINTKQKLASGLFKVFNYDLACMYADEILFVLEYFEDYETLRAVPKNFVLAMLRFLRDSKFSITRLNDKLALDKKTRSAARTLKGVKNPKDYETIILAIYNNSNKNVGLLRDNEIYNLPLKKKIETL